MRSILVKGADRIELTIRSYTHGSNRQNTEEEDIPAGASLHREG